MTYDVYAMFLEGSYLIASSNDRDHGLNFAERICKEVGEWPNAFATLTRGVHTIRGPIFTLNEFKARSN
jgi:hypothetical protein